MSNNILVLVGSRRPGSVNEQLAQPAIAALPGEAKVTRFEQLDELPHYSEAGDNDTAPAVVERFRAAVAAADAVLVVTPQYNGAMPSTLKNAIDWASRPRDNAALAGKTVAVLGASPSPRGPVWAIENAERVLKVAGASVAPVTFALASAHQAFVDGLSEDDRTALEAVVRQLRPALVDA